MSGRTEVLADIGAATSINLSFTCNDPGSSKTFYIDNILIKDLGATITVQTNTVLNEPFNSGSSYPWMGTQAAITYSTNTMHVSGPSVFFGAGVSRTMDLLPGQIYKVRFDLAASSIGTSTMSFGFSGGSSALFNVYDYSVPMTSGLSTYTFYVIPKTTQNAEPL